MKQKNLSGKILSIPITIGALVILLLVGIYVAFYVLQTNKLTDVTTTTAITDTATSNSTTEDNSSDSSDQTADWLTYTNEEYGFSFKYPTEYGEFNITKSASEIGYQIIGGFVTEKSITLDASSTNWSEGRSADFTDFIKYIKDGDDYFHNYYAEKIFQFMPYDSIKSADSTEVLLVNRKSYLDFKDYTEGEMLTFENTVPAEGSIAALINLPNNQDKEIKGLLITDRDTSRITESEFKQILSTFKFTD